MVTMGFLREVKQGERRWAIRKKKMVKNELKLMRLRIS